MLKKFICLFLICSMLIPYLSIYTNASSMTPNSIITTDCEIIDQSTDFDGDGIPNDIEIYYGSNIYSTDTDGDTVSDYIELFITHTDCNKADGQIDSDGDGISNADEVMLGTDAGDRDSDGDRLSDKDELHSINTDPLLADTDSDGLYDDVEIKLGLNPRVAKSNGVTLDSETPDALAYFADQVQNAPYLIGSPNNLPISTLVIPLPEDYGDGGDLSVDATLGLIEDNTVYPTSVSYTLDYTDFFASNMVYNSDLAVTSSLLSANAYDNYYLYVDSGAYSSTVETSMRDWMQYHLMTDYKNYDLNDYFLDQHVSEMYIARKELTYNGVTKNIICVVIRGTNGTLEEWQSNFDLGSTIESPHHSEWSNTTNHKGFDITANRLNAKLSEYISQYCSGKSNVLWIMGHSRGGALANILAAKRIDAGNTVFAYTFAAPNTTVLSNANTTSKYQCIFNIVNEDDYVAKLPMAGWGFRRYGIDKSASINNNYKAEWNDLTSYPSGYNHDAIGMTDVLDSLTAIASNRNACYSERTGSDGYISGSALTANARNQQRDAILSTYTSNLTGTYRVVNIDDNLMYSYYIYQKPAFFMQVLAAMMGGAIGSPTFLGLEVAPYLVNAKNKIISAYLGGMNHPHYVESYYLLATKLY